MADEDLKFGIKVEINADDIKRQSKDIESSLENTFTNLAENIQREMNSIGGNTHKILGDISNDIKVIANSLTQEIEQSLWKTEKLHQAIQETGQQQLNVAEKTLEQLNHIRDENSRKTRKKYEEDLGFIGDATLSAMNMISKVGGAFGIGLGIKEIVHTISDTAQTAQDVRGLGTSTQSFTKFQQAAKQEGISEQNSGAFIAQMSEMMQSALSANPAVNQSARAKMNAVYQLFDNNPALDPRTHNFFLGYDPVQYQKLIYDASIKKSQDDQAKGLSTTTSQAMAKAETDVLGFLPRTQVEKYARPDFWQKYENAPGINNIDAEKMMHDQQIVDQALSTLYKSLIHFLANAIEALSHPIDFIKKIHKDNEPNLKATDKAIQEQINENKKKYGNNNWKIFFGISKDVLSNLYHDPINTLLGKSNINENIKNNITEQKRLLSNNNSSNGYDFVKDDQRLAFAQMMKESSGNPDMIGGAGEIGLFQVKPNTMEMMYNMGLINKKYSDKEMKDPKVSKYLRDQYMELAKKATIESLGYSGLSDQQLKDRGLLEQVEIGTLERYNAGTNAKHIPYKSMEYANNIFGMAKGTNSAVTINNNINVHGSMTKQDIDYLQQQLGTSNQKAVYMAQRAGII